LLKGEENMALETKVIIIGMAEFAKATKNKGMYDYAKSLASAENLVLPPYYEDKDEDKNTQK